MHWLATVVAAILVAHAAALYTDVKFHPGKSHPYDPAASKSFTCGYLKYGIGHFKQNYGDGSGLSGVMATERIEFGRFKLRAKFGCITFCNSPDFNGVDGILGFGRPAPGWIPLIYTMVHQKVMPHPRFAFLSSKDVIHLGSAELHLGGFDESAIEGKMFRTPTISGGMAAGSYAVAVTGMKFGPHKLMDFSGHQMPGLLDSGSSCLVIPQEAYVMWSKLQHKNLTFTIQIAGKFDVEIAHDIWFMKGLNAEGSFVSASTPGVPCVQPSPAPMIVLGDVLFRKYVVLFDLSSLLHPTIGIAKQNPSYKFGSWHPTVKKVTATRHVNKKLAAAHSAALTKLAATHSARLTKLVPKKSVDKITIFNKHATQYFINITLGTPKQTRTVTFDTGSSMFGVFCKAPKGYTRRSIFGGAGQKSAKARETKKQARAKELAEAAKMAKEADQVT